MGTAERAGESVTGAARGASAPGGLARVAGLAIAAGACGWMAAWAPGQPVPEAPTGAMPTPSAPSGTPMPIEPPKPDTSADGPGAAAEQSGDKGGEKDDGQPADGQSARRDRARTRPSGAMSPSAGKAPDPAAIAPGARPGMDPAAAARAAMQAKAAAQVAPGEPGAVKGPTGANGAGAAGGAGGVGAPLPAIGDDEMITLSPFAEPIQLRTLVDLVARTLNINVSTLGELPGEIVFNAPVEVPKRELLALLDSLLEQNGFTITRDAATGWYTVSSATAVQVAVGGEQSTTRIFPTPNLRPSALKAAIESQLGIMPQAGGGARQYAYIDELGVIVATDSPRRLARIEALLEALIAEYNRARFIRLDVQHIAAPVARDRALQLIGVVQQPGAVLQPGVPGAQGGTARLENLGDRLTVDAQGNALLFRGLPDEIERVQEVLAVVDVPNTLQPVQYFAGTAAAQIAQLARERGLGEVSLFASDGQGVPGQVFDGRQNRAFNAAQGVLGTQSTTTTGGSVMIVDEARGIILYYATPTQHRQMDDLVRTLDTQSERVVIKTYKLNHQKAEDVAAIIQGLLNNQSLAGEAPLLPGGGQNTRGGLNPNRRTLRSIAQGSPQAGGGELSLDGTDSFVIPDEGNNQIVVKAPLGQQADFARLIEKLDLRKAQVYIEAKIVAVTADEGFRLAFETQLINASGTGGALNTNFGLGSFGTGGNFTQPKSVATGLAGLTAAVIKSDQIPIIMTALANTTDTRIIAAPQLLVDDNTEAEVVSVDEQPFTETTQTSGNPSQTSFAGFAEAGTTLTVTPQISPGGYLRLDYSAELSSFTGDPPSPGVPPPRQTNNLRGNVTVPGDFTVVVGGLTFDTSRKTVVKVPLLGDIPLVGLLFQDLRDSDRRTTLYLFLTPRILNEPNFEDLVLLSRGPQWEMLKTRDVPELKPTVIEVTPAPRDRAVLPWDAAVRRPEDDEGGGAQRDQGAEGAS